MYVKNPIIDKLVNLLVDITFTDKEKEERTNDLKQLKVGNLRFMESIKKNSQGEAVLQELHPDTSMPGKMSCAMVAHLLLSELRNQFQVNIDEQNIVISDFLLGLHIEMYNRDWKSLHLIYRSIPMSALCSSFF